MIATVPGNPDQGVIFCYEKGAMLNYNSGSVTSRRIGFFLPTSIPTT